MSTLTLFLVILGANLVSAFIMLFVNMFVGYLLAKRRQEYEDQLLAEFSAALEPKRGYDN